MIDFSNFNSTKEEHELYSKIAKRAVELAPYPIDHMSLVMDLEACHKGDYPLDLEGMLNGRDLDLLHDLVGIANSLDRETGKVGNCFVPRYAARA